MNISWTPSAHAVVRRSEERKTSTQGEACADEFARPRGVEQVEGRARARDDAAIPSISRDVNHQIHRPGRQDAFALMRRGMRRGSPEKNEEARKRRGRA